MPIYRLAYRHWEGARLGWGARWRAFTTTGTAALWNSRFRRWVVILGVMPVIVYGTFVWACAEFVFGEEEGVINRVFDWLGGDASKLVRESSEARAALWTLILFGFLTRPGAFVGLFVVMVFGAGLIAADRRHHAHEVYFARPVGWADYVVGKLSVIGVYLGVVLLVPALALFLEIVLFSPRWSDIWFLLDLVPRLVLAWALWTVLAGLPMLAISSLGRSSGLAGFLWAVLWIGSELVSGVAKLISVGVTALAEAGPHGRHRGPPDWAYPDWTEGFSLGDNLIALHHGVLGGDTITRHFGHLPVLGVEIRMITPGLSAWVSLALLGGLALVSLVILRWRVRPEGAA